MKTNRKGLSEVVTAVLIILLIVAAIAAIWAFVNPSVKSAGAGLNKANVCTQNTIELTACASAAASPFTTTVDIRRVSTTLSPATLRIRARDASGANLGNELSTLGPGNDGATQTGAAITGMTGKANSALLTADYKLPDGSTVSCTAQPVVCT